MVTCRLCTVYMGLNPLSITCHLRDLRQVAPHFYTLSYPIANKDFRIHHTGLLGKLNPIIHAKFLFFFLSTDFIKISPIVLLMSFVTLLKMTRIQSRVTYCIWFPGFYFLLFKIFFCFFCFLFFPFTFISWRLITLHMLSF